MLKYYEFNWTNTVEILIIPLCILTASLLMGLTLNKMINKRLQTRMQDVESLQYVLANAIKGVPVALCCGIGVYWTITALPLTTLVQTLLSNILLGIILFTMTRVIARILVGLIEQSAQKNAATMPKTSLLNNIVNIVVYAIGILIILQSYGISVTPIITALGIGGMALALGLQETLANIFAGLHLIVSRQIRIGDYIKLSSGEEGCVADIAWRFTTIQATSNNMVVIPNQKIASAIITNYNMPKQDITVVVPVGVSYDSDLEHVERVTLDVAKAVMSKVEQSITTEPAVRFHTFADSSINFNVILHSSRFVNQFPLKHEFIKALMKRYREENIEIPYPIRTILQK